MVLCAVFPSLLNKIYYSAVLDSPVVGVLGTGTGTATPAAAAVGDVVVGSTKPQLHTPQPASQPPISTITRGACNNISKQSGSLDVLLFSLPPHFMWLLCSDRNSAELPGSVLPLSNITRPIRPPNAMPGNPTANRTLPNEFLVFQSLNFIA